MIASRRLRNDQNISENDQNIDFSLTIFGVRVIFVFILSFQKLDEIKFESTLVHANFKRQLQIPLQSPYDVNVKYSLDASIIGSFCSLDFIRTSSTTTSQFQDCWKLKSKRILPQNDDIQNTSTRHTEMHRPAHTCGGGSGLPVLHIDWSTVQSKEFAAKTVIFFLFCCCFRSKLFSMECVQMTPLHFEIFRCNNIKPFYI